MLRVLQKAFIVAKGKVSRASDFFVVCDFWVAFHLINGEFPVDEVAQMPFDLPNK